MVVSTVAYVYGPWPWWVTVSAVLVAAVVVGFVLWRVFYDKHSDVYANG
jgi:hypothetical protein